VNQIFGKCAACIKQRHLVFGRCRTKLRHHYKPVLAIIACLWFDEVVCVQPTPCILDLFIEAAF